MFIKGAEKKKKKQKLLRFFWFLLVFVMVGNGYFIMRVNDLIKTDHF